MLRAMHERDCPTGPALRRRDALALGAAGLGVFWTMAVEDARSCERLKGADVEIWHADADGEYSGVGTSAPSSRWLRGHQRTNAKWVARFETMYPGWYPGRTPHIHLKVHVSGDAVHTGQLFFKDSVSRAVYRTRHYSSRGRPDTSNAGDGIYERGSLLRLSKGTGERRYVGRKTLVVEA